MNITTEKHVKIEVKKLLDTFKRDIKYWMPSASVYGERGIPDFVGCLLGRFIGIETKSPDRGPKGLTAMQTRFKKEAEEAGGICFVVWDWPTILMMHAKLCVIKKEIKHKTKIERGEK